MEAKNIAELSADIDRVKTLFTYHTPDEDAIAAMKVIRDKAYDLAVVIVSLTPKSADQSAAIRLLREAVMTANASIVLDGK